MVPEYHKLNIVWQKLCSKYCLQNCHPSGVHLKWIRNEVTFLGIILMSADIFVLDILKCNRKNIKSQ